MSAFIKNRNKSNGAESEKTRLFLFTDGFPYGKGEKTFVIPELKYLSQEYEVTIVAPTYRCAIEDKENRTELGTNIHLITYCYPRRIKYLLFCIKFFFSRAGWIEIYDLLNDGFSWMRLADSVSSFAIAERLRVFCKSAGVFCDLDSAIYYSFWFGNVALSLALQYSRTPMKNVARLNGYDLYNERNPYQRQPFKRYMRDRYDLLLFGADYAKSYFEKTFGAARFDGQYLVNRLGVARQYDHASYCNDEFLLVSCSNVIPLKRVDQIARAIARISGISIRWVHFGGGPDLSMLKNTVINLGIRADIRGASPNDEILKFYNDNPVSCFISTSSTEGGFPVSIQEAMSFGLPIIATDAGGAINEGIDGNGILLKNDATIEDIANAITKIACMQRWEWERLSQRSIELWNERYNVHENKRSLLYELQKLSRR